MTTRVAHRTDSPIMSVGPPPARPAPRQLAGSRRPTDLPKSASYTYLPAVKDSAYAKITPLPVRIRGDTSAEDLTASLDNTDVSPPDSSGFNTPIEDGRIPANMADGLTAKLEDIQRSSYEGSSSSSDKRRSVGESSQDVDIEPEAPVSTPNSLAKRLGRRMSFIGSRSPSPSKIEAKRSDVAAVGSVDTGSPRTSRALTKKGDAITSNPILPAPARPDFSKRRNTFIANKENTRSVKAFLPKSFSTDKLHSVVEHTDDAMPLPSPRLLNTERNGSTLSLSMPKKRDELWGVFRSLDGDFAKFQSKSTPFKANVIRQTLLPFLRNYADHPTNYELRAEDLDRRVVILNKWWVGLIELIHGRNNQSMSGTDRPTILDALSGLMDRPEWRPSPTIFCPVSRRKSDTPSTRTKSSASFASSGSEFLNESVLQNVRNMFVQNLNAQMAFVAEKMSLRNAAASLITFCGKAIAWAFFYCPGVADVLAREWQIDADGMKRVLQAHGISKYDNLKDTSAEVSSAFPPAIRTLAFTTLPKMARSLREPAELPLLSTGLEMYGYWRDRWLGRESDLLYVFVKHFFVLANDYLPPDAPKKQRIASPGMLVVQAQILNNLDSTINRDLGPSSESSTSASPTFDDLLGGPDAVVSSIPILPPNATRIMSENRLIMLIRDFLSDRVAEHSAARHLFAVSFCDLLSACARGISSFNHAACYTICDFLAEALVIITRYEQSSFCPGQVIDFPFWVDVFSKMLASHNTVTQIRVFAFLYTAWNTLCWDSKRKEQLCLGLLLNKDVFETTFLHWCPMVRAYYMRLICWRVARHDGEANELDTKILEAAFERLRYLWAYHLFDKERAEAEGKSLEFSTPCNPAPGRRFLIVRTDTQIAPGGAFMAFNGIIPPTPTAASDKRPGRVLTADSPTRPLSIASDDSDGLSPKDGETGIRGFLRGIMGARKRSQSRDKKSSSPNKGPTSVANPSDDAMNRPRDRQALIRAPPPVPAYRNYCFKFSLEFLPRPHGPRQAAKQQLAPVKLLPPRLPLAAQKYLQDREPDLPAVQAAKSDGIVQTQYVGRALAEWAIIVSECQGFFDRRKAEGVPSDKEVETPTLGVELFRRSA